MSAAPARGHDYRLPDNGAESAHRVRGVTLIRDHQVWGQIDQPMYELALTLKGCWTTEGPANKCWMVLLRGEDI